MKTAFLAATAAILFFLGTLAGPSMAEPLIDMTSGFKVTIAGDYKATDDDTWHLGKGAVLRVTSKGGKLRETLEAIGDTVEVHCGEAGISEASGIFVFEATRTDATHYRFPRHNPSFSENFQINREEPFLFSEGGLENPQAANWVAFENGEFNIGGLASVEAEYPATAEGPKMLVSVGGSTSQTRVTSDLKSVLKFKADSFPFWRAARADLDEEERFVHGMAIDPGSVGAAAYSGQQKDMLAGIKKIREGYQLLQRNLYSQKVIDKMLQEGVPIPRLTLAEVSIVRAGNAFSIRPFVNWRGEGRVLVDRARLETGSAPPGSAPSVTFEIQDLAHRMLEDTRLVIESGDSYIENSRPGNRNWNRRVPIQFDLDLIRSFAADGDTFRFRESVDATGFFVRKEIQAAGVIRSSTLAVLKHSLAFEFKPKSSDKAAALEYSKFLGIKRMLLVPGGARRSKLLPVLSKDEKVLDFLQEGLDRLAAAIFKQGIQDITALEVRLSDEHAPLWSVTARVADNSGKVAQAACEKDLPGVPGLEEIWKKLDSKRTAADWLDFEGLR
jgi:hypothetical protein